MHGVPAGRCRAAGRAVAVSGFIAVAALGGIATASAQPSDPGCDAFGWRHPMCAGGAWSNETASQEWGPANIPNPVTPGGDMSMTFPGSPNTP